MERGMSNADGAVILGESTNNDNLEWTVRKAIDCGGVFTDGAQAVNYITKHAIEGLAA
jgi:pullulanase